MSLTSLSVNQQAQFQQTHSERRAVSLASRFAPTESQSTDTKPVENQLQNNQVSQQVAIETIDFFHAKYSQMTHAESSQEDGSSDDIYQRPLPPSVELMKVILEGLFGKNFDESLDQLSLSDELQGSGVSVEPYYEQSTQDTSDIVDIDGQSFNREDILNVEVWQSYSQSMSYQMTGTFDVNGQQLNVNFSYAIASERSQYSAVEITAGALKDPLVLQYGDHGLGEMVDSVSFDINQDGSSDELPIFAGDVGYLVFDKNNNHHVDDASELFGPQTGNGFGELAQLDRNSNGFIDRDDDVYHQLYIWRPQQSNQLMSLDNAQIQAIYTSAIDTPYSFYNSNGNVGAQIRQSTFALSDSGLAKGIHQVDVRV